MKISLIVHCHQYHRLLCYQLSSLLHHPPGSGLTVQVTVYRALDDTSVADTCQFFGPRLRDVGVDLDEQPRARVQVCRRGILRNEAALANRADWIWFADVDYCVGPEFLTTLPGALASVPQELPLVYPRQVLATTQEQGDAWIAAVSVPQVVAVDIAGLAPLRYSKAIGGVQFVRGAMARVVGYCPDDARAQRPAVNWVRTHEDVRFRRILGTDGFAVHMPQLIRIRHSRRGGHGTQEVHL